MALSSFSIFYFIWDKRLHKKNYDVMYYIALFRKFKIFRKKQVFVLLSKVSSGF